MTLAHAVVWVLFGCNLGLLWASGRTFDQARRILDTAAAHLAEVDSLMEELQGTARLSKSKEKP